MNFARIDGEINAAKNFCHASFGFDSYLQVFNDKL
jgi:hypothetical protein